MNSALFVAVFLSNALLTTVAVNKCYSCLANSWDDCDKTPSDCSGAILGKTHCYSAFGKYDNGSAILDGVARGCIDCSDKKKACEDLKLVLKLTNYDLLTCDIQCCEKDLCNTMISRPKTRETRSQTTLPTSSVVVTLTTLCIWVLVVA